MALPRTDTLIAYPDGDVSSAGEVLHVAPAADGRSVVLLDRTAFHPVDLVWPDQPADRGVLRTSTAEHRIVDAVVGGVHDGVLLLGGDVPVRTGTEGWTFVVGHLVEGEPPAVGDRVDVEADPGHRAALSAGHTGCHLASLALDAALADAWRKPVQADSLGAPAFDALAIERSRITPDGSTDRYRIGKSLRRKGFDPEALADLPGLAARVDAALAAWVASAASVHVDRETEALSARRTWVCALPDATATIPCGGTHVASLGELERITVSFDAQEAPGAIELTMRTSVLRRRGPARSDQEADRS